MAPVVGLEPTTYGLTGHRSTIELHRKIFMKDWRARQDSNLQPTD